MRQEAQIFYRDIYDHIVRIQDLTQGVRDLGDNALATYLSSVGIQQNETMKTLTIVATIMLPLTVAAGIYGMNFAHMPELGWPWAYFALLGAMGTYAAVMLSWFWGRELLRRSRRRIGRAALFLVERERLLGARHFLLRSFQP